MKYFSLSFLLILYDSPIFIKFIKSGFIKYVDFKFLLFFQENFLMHTRRPDKDIENFVDLYFKRHIRKKFENDLLCCLTKAVNELVPQSIRRPLILRLRFKECYLNSILKVTNYNCLRDLPRINTSIYKSGFVCRSVGTNKTEGISELLFKTFKRKIYRSFKVYKNSLYIIFSGLPSSSFAVSEKFSYHCINKKYTFYCCSSINKEDLIHQYSFKLKWLNCLYLLFFKGLYIYFFFFAPSNLDILFQGGLNNKRHKNFDHLFDFALEGLEQFNYRKTRIQSPGHYKSFHKKNLKATIISGEVLKDLPITLNNYFLRYSNKTGLTFATVHINV
nr:hypothetical protein [Silvetia siliquosa]